MRSNLQNQLRNPQKVIITNQTIYVNPLTPAKLSIGEASLFQGQMLLVRPPFVLRVLIVWLNWLFTLQIRFTPQEKRQYCKSQKNRYCLRYLLSLWPYYLLTCLIFFLDFIFTRKLSIFVLVSVQLGIIWQNCFMLLKDNFLEYLVQFQN